jgi:hypothetical protein
MKSNKSPDFLKGTFNWSRLGLFHAGPSPINLLAPEALGSDQSWVSIAAIIEHAKQGDHSYIPLLQQWYHTDEEYLDRISIILTGIAGRKKDIVSLPKLMRDGPDAARTYACNAAVGAGYLWLVPSMLDAWKRVVSLPNHETIGYAIAQMLEEPDGPIAENAGNYNTKPESIETVKDQTLQALLQEVAADEQSPPEFELLVEARFNELKEKFGTDQVLIWEGNIFGVRRLAEKTLDLIYKAKKRGENVSLFAERRQFEAATGIDCSAFFQNMNLQPLAAAEILESFLESSAVDKYEDSVRYFFGHRIPD